MAKPHIMEGIPAKVAGFMVFAVAVGTKNTKYPTIMAKSDSFLCLILVFSP